MPIPAKPDPLKFCAACKKQMHRQRYNGVLESNLNFRRRKYCDQKCMAVGQTREVVTSLSHTRTKAHARVRRACEICGKVRKLHVHHRDENPFNNVIGNLQTLCVSCHRRSHSPNYLGTPLLPRRCLHCSKPVARKNLCNTHLTRLKRYGDPLLKKYKTASGWVLSRADS